MQSQHQRPEAHYSHKQELLAKCHPLGMFDAIATLAVASNMRELYRLVLVGLLRAFFFGHLFQDQHTPRSKDCLQPPEACGVAESMSQPGRPCCC